MSVYLDYNSSAPISSEVLEYMFKVYKDAIGNADSRTHDFGDHARVVVEDARKKVADILSVKSDEIFFTSGATEANNIAIQGLVEYAEQSGKNHIITSAIEHKSVLETVKSLEKKGFIIDIVNPDISGRVSSDSILKRVTDKTLLVSVMHVNNETGIIQPVDEIGIGLRDKDVFFHIDATQSFGKLIDELRQAPYDMLSMSAHKISGPQGVGALVLRKKNYKRPPVRNILYGGQQEHGIRPGTVPVALIAGLGEACRLAQKNHVASIDKSLQIKERLLRLLKESGLKYTINGNQDYCVNSCINLSFQGVSSEALMISTKQYCGISNGSACNSKSYQPSYVLSAMGIPTEQIENSVRISWGADSDREEVERNFASLLSVAKQLAI